MKVCISSIFDDLLEKLVLPDHVNIHLVFPQMSHSHLCKKGINDGSTLARRKDCKSENVTYQIWCFSRI